MPVALLGWVLGAAAGPVNQLANLGWMEQVRLASAELYFGGYWGGNYTCGLDGLTLGGVGEGQALLPCHVLPWTHRGCIFVLYWPIAAL